MPKENTDCIAGTGLRTEVSWWPGDTGHVQIATINQSSEMKLEDGGTPDNPDGLFYGWHATLDREGINRIIRSLRKARDSVYGRDE